VNESTAYAVSVLLLLVGAAVIPWLAMRALVPTLESGGKGLAENYRGRPLVVALGLVWIIWTLALMTVSFIDSIYASLISADGVPIFSEFAIDGLPFLLVIGALVLGMADDTFGSVADKGFRGHLSALLHGRLTTGTLKLFGIGLLAAFSLAPDFGSLDVPVWILTGEWVLQVLAIALTANLLNLTDLRPGRALKVYAFLSLIGCVLIGVSSGWGIVPLLAIISFGPLLAVWGFDLRERGMLGDAGANAAGVFVGWVLANALVAWWWALAAYVVLVLALNLLSEKVSFSAVIEKVAFLRWIDGLGRVKENSHPI
jgi:UDP-GlcNAc:undecaprenyl-phosphate/decaprenyl-phosphate GlcNAc-1-phosphate transferase